MLAYTKKGDIIMQAGDITVRVRHAGQQHTAAVSFRKDINPNALRICYSGYGGQKMANKIKTMRLAKKMSQGELAKQLGICSSYMCEIETGRKFASFKMLCKLSQVFGCELQELLEDQAARRQKQFQAEEIIESMETKTDDEIHETRVRIGEAMLIETMTLFQTLDFTSRKKVLTYVKDLKKASSAG